MLLPVNGSEIVRNINVLNSTFCAYDSLSTYKFALFLTRPGFLHMGILCEYIWGFESNHLHDACFNVYD